MVCASQVAEVRSSVDGRRRRTSFLFVVFVVILCSIYESFCGSDRPSHTRVSMDEYSTRYVHHSRGGHTITVVFVLSCVSYVRDDTVHYVDRLEVRTFWKPALILHSFSSCFILRSRFSSPPPPGLRKSPSSVSASQQNSPSATS